jgi:predicted RNA binding protein YcfA (HicA-like mRNA interferase family)
VPKLQAVNYRKVVKLVEKLGYSFIRQTGSHMRFSKLLESGEAHNITVPKHDEIKKGTLNDILSRLSEKNKVPKDDLITILNDLLLL